MKFHILHLAMISVLDRGVGEVVKAVQEKGIMNNTIIMFYSDNGAPTERYRTSTAGSNYPLKGVCTPIHFAAELMTQLSS